MRVIERTHSWSRVRESDLRERAVVRGILFSIYVYDFFSEMEIVAWGGAGVIERRMLLLESLLVMAYALYE